MMHPKNPWALHGRGRTRHLSRGPGPNQTLCVSKPGFLGLNLWSCSFAPKLLDAVTARSNQGLFDDVICFLFDRILPQGDREHRQKQRPISFQPSVCFMSDYPKHSMWTAIGLPRVPARGGARGGRTIGPNLIQRPHGVSPGGKWGGGVSLWGG